MAHIIRYRGVAGVLGAIAVLGLHPVMSNAVPISAGAPFPGLFDLVSEVQDATLAGQRGRYVGNGNLLYFGVEMVTTWQSPNGRLASGLLLSTDAQLRPTVSIINQGSIAGGNSSSTPTNGTHISLGGISNVAGAAQSIQIGGDGNAVKNDINLNLTTNLPPGSSQPGAIPVTTAGTQVLSRPGEITMVNIGRDGLSLAVNVPGQGSVLQQLRSGMGLLQATQTTGDLNMIHNIININAGLSMPSGLNNAGIGSALGSLKGLQLK